MTADHIREVYGRASPVTFRGLSVVEDGMTLASSGYYIENAHVVLVCMVAPEGRALLAARRHWRMVILLAREMLKLASALGLPMRAWADPAVYGSANLLRHLGFTHLGRDIWERA